VLTAILIGAAAGVSAPGAIPEAQAGPDSRRVDRQIYVFERVVDDMLVESPNFLVRSGDPSRGTYVEGHGAVFNFRTSLVGDQSHSGWNMRWIWSSKDDDDEDRWDGDRYSKRELERQARRYERGKREILEMLADFGDLLTGLEDDEWVEIDARLRGAEYFEEQDLGRLKVKARIRDLRAHAEGSLSEEDLYQRIEMDES
jgi:hypothetical protein